MNGTIKAGIPGGEVIPIGLMATVENIMTIYRTGQYILMNPATQDFVMFCPYGSSNWFFVGFSGGKNLMNLRSLTGNASEAMTFSQLVEYLEGKGWTYVAPSALPAGFGTLLANPIPAIIILPGGQINDPYPTVLD
jgi:hypothetical protein